jgi:hypothetical protein
VVARPFIALNGASAMENFLQATGISPAKLQDAAVVGLFYLAGLVSLYFGYRGGGRTWVRRHGLVWRLGRKRRLISGFYPEMLIFTACTILLLVVDCAAPNVTLIGTVGGNPGVSLGAVGFVALIVIAYSIYAVRSANDDPAERAGDRKRLARAYTAYTPYSIILFCGGALVLVMLARQFAVDQISFDAEAGRVRALFIQAQALHATHLRAIGGGDLIGAEQFYAQALSTIETAQGRLSLATTLLQDQMNPVFIFATAVFAVNILIRFTPAKNAFLDGARSMTLVSTALAIGLCFLFGLYTYFHSYAGLLADSITRMHQIAPDSRLGAWEMTQRYNEVFVSLNERKNLFGLIKAIGGEGSGMATFVFGVQFALERLSDRDEKRAGRSEILPYKEWRDARIAPR